MMRIGIATTAITTMSSDATCACLMPRKTDGSVR